MDKSPGVAANGPSSRRQSGLSRESTSTITPTTDSQHSRRTSQTSGLSSVTASPLPSREASPTRPVGRIITNRAPSTIQSQRSRKNIEQDLSPYRSAKPAHTPSVSRSKSLTSTQLPILRPAASDSNIRAPAPVSSKPTVNTDSAREHNSPRWPVSSRLRSPPPIVIKPSFPLARRAENETPAITLQQALPVSESSSDAEVDEAVPQPGLRIPARGAGASSSTLETVQEVSPHSSPKGTGETAENLEDSVLIEASSQADTTDAPSSKSLAGKINPMGNESGIESGTVKVCRRSAVTSAPQLATRKSSTPVKPSNCAKGKAGEASLQSMTVETETVTSIPQVALAPGVGGQGLNGILRTKPSTETIRPRKEKKKQPRKQPSGTGEPQSPTVANPRLRHRLSFRSISSIIDVSVSSTRPGGRCFEGAMSPTRHSRSQSLMGYPMNTLLTRNRPASSKADIFEAKVASAVEEANSSDSEETFVYDSNPPDGRDRPHRFHHSRTPSATSMVSQVDRNGMRSIHPVMKGVAGHPVVVKKSMKFVNSFNPNGGDVGIGDEESKGTFRSGAGSARGTSRHHHHMGRWSRNGSNGHASIMSTEESPFAAPVTQRSLMVNNSRIASGPTSPRLYNISRGTYDPQKRGSSSAAGYDMDDAVAGADDESTPLMGTSRSNRSSRRRYVGQGAIRMEPETYRTPPSVLNRFASCLVLTMMLLLIVSGAIGFMFATSQPLQDIKLVNMTNVVASEQELMLDLTVQANNPNVVVVVVDAANIEVFAKSPRAGTDSEYWRHPDESATFAVRRKSQSHSSGVETQDDSALDPPQDDSPPIMRLGSIKEFDSPLSFEGSFLHQGLTSSTGEVRLVRPGNGTQGGSERWEHILEDEFELILKGVLRYTLPLSQNVRSVAVSGRAMVKPNAVNDPPSLRPNGTDFSVEA